MKLHWQRQTQKRPMPRIINYAQCCSTTNIATKVAEDRTQKLSAHADLSNAAAEKKCQRHRQSVFQFFSRTFSQSSIQSSGHAAPS